MKMAWAWLVLSATMCAQAQRQTQAFDSAWRFQQGDAEGAAAPGFTDAAWTTVDLPHDWAIAGPFAADNASGGQGGFAPAGIGWYRKHFALPAKDGKKRVFVEFDGVMANSDVWINGFLLGHRPNGYVSFRYELTGQLKFGGDNIIAVKADNAKQPSSRFYEGAGIYRHVRLLVMDPVHLAQWSTFVSASGVTATSAQVKVRTQVENQTAAEAAVSLEVTLLDPAGKTAGRATIAAKPVAAGQEASFETSVAVTAPDRWDMNHPALYRARVEVLSAGKTSDEEEVRFGIRDVHFEPETGFWINGRNVKLLGVALHSDVGSLGMAAPMGAWEHRLAAMKALGANAIRTAHNPVAPEFLDLCDRMGLVVMDEMFDVWTVAKNQYDYHLHFMDWYLRDAADTVRRDRNHPSVILWSAGNEIHDTPNAELAKSILGPMIKTFHENDPTRPVTQALFRPNVSHDYDDGLADMLDVVGQNYRPQEILAARRQKPGRKIVGTENTHERDQWVAVRDHADYSGMFVWAGTDYLGESRRWPMIGDASGLDDRTDAPKADALERESWWKTAPVVHLVRRVAPAQRISIDPGYEPGSPQAQAVGGAPARRAPGVALSDAAPQSAWADWTPKDLGPHPENVEVFSNCDEVELYLNGKSLGVQELHPDATPRKWAVPFTPGELKAIGRQRGQDVATETLRTAGKPARLLLTVEQGRLSTAWDDVAYVRASVVDGQGTVVPDAAVPLTFSTSAPGTILTTDNGNLFDTSGFGRPERTSFHGRAIAIVRATAAAGDVTVKVSSDGLAGAAATLHISP